MKSASKTAVLLKNFRHTRPVSVSRIGTTFLSPTGDFEASLQRRSLSSWISMTPHSHENQVLDRLSSKYADTTTDKRLFGSLTPPPFLQQRHLLASIPSGRKATESRWRFSQYVLGAMWRFQSQLNLLCANDASAGVKAPGRTIDCEELLHMVEEGVRFLLIDVRDRKEVETTGSIQGAKLIPLLELKTALLMDEDEFVLKYGFSKPAKTDRNIVFYGQGAVKSSAALEIAGRLGYRGVLRMAGGYDEWIEKTHLDGRI